MKNIDSVLPDQVINQEDNEKVAHNGLNALVPTAAALAAIIIIGSAYYVSRDTSKSNSNNTTIENDNNIVSNENDIFEEVSPVIYNEVNPVIYNNENEIEVKSEPVILQDNVQVNNLNTLNIDYSNVTAFYNHIKDNRNKFGTFAESFQSEEDIKQLINFIYMFDGLYDTYGITSSISSQQQFDEIVSDYYYSCAKNQVDGQLHTLFKKDSLIYIRLKEAENLADNLKNGKGTDYTISNNYYTWLGVNLIDERTKMKPTTKNAPLIDLLREQYDEYRSDDHLKVGNMLEARKYQKNDSLPIPKIDLYYDYTYPEDVKVTETQNSFSCPDWGIDNIISKSEETTETKLITKIDGTPFFAQVEMAFDEVLNKRKVR